jgi:hypothetical protein
VLNTVAINLVAPQQPVTKPRNNGDFGDGGGGNLKFYNGDPYGDDLRQP